MIWSDLHCLALLLSVIKKNLTEIQILVIKELGHTNIFTISCIYVCINFCMKTYSLSLDTKKSHIKASYVSSSNNNNGSLSNNQSKKEKYLRSRWGDNYLVVFWCWILAQKGNPQIPLRQKAYNKISFKMKGMKLTLDLQRLFLLCEKGGGVSALPPPIS